MSGLAIMKCRLCGLKLNEANHIFEIKKAPKGAQYLPDKKEYASSDCSAPLRLLQCNGCGHYQLAGYPVAYWKEVITAAGFSSAMRAFRSDQLGEWIRNYNLKGKKIMEIGCGVGHLLDILSFYGANASGFEYGPVQVREGRKFGREIFQEHILNDRFDFPSLFDGFICINYLEHTPEPIKFLRAIKRGCRSGAVGIIEVPNFQKDIDQDKSHNLIRDHLSYFTQKTLSLAIQLAGFDLICIHDCWYGEDIQAVIKVPYPSPITNWAFGTPTVKAFSKIINGNPGRLALWGASHQALTLIGMIQPTNVLCIADSAPFKQGKVDPVCGIPIVSPEELINYQPDLTIIIAGGYSQEIKNDLGKNKAFTGQAIILDEVVL